MENVKLSLNEWVCDSGIYCKITNEFIGCPIESEKDGLVILKWLNGLDESDFEKLIFNNQSVLSERRTKWAYRPVKKLKGV